MRVNCENCPECQEHGSDVVDSRPGELGRVRRRRCPHCDARWSTVEVLVDPVLKRQLRRDLAETVHDLNATIAQLELARDMLTGVRPPA